MKAMNIEPTMAQALTTVAASLPLMSAATWARDKEMFASIRCLHPCSLYADATSHLATRLNAQQTYLAQDGMDAHLTKVGASLGRCFTLRRRPSLPRREPCNSSALRPRGR